MKSFLNKKLNSIISEENPVGTAGFEFVEFVHNDPLLLQSLFFRMGFTALARHKFKNITLWGQGNILYVINGDYNSYSFKQMKQKGPGSVSMAWRVADADYAFQYAMKKGVTPYYGQDKVINAPAIMGLGGALIYFIDRYDEQYNVYGDEFEWLGQIDVPRDDAGFYYIDHITQNVENGSLDHWWHFYHDIFGFKPIHSHHIDKKLSGFASRALASPCGKIRIPLHELNEPENTLDTYLHKYSREGTQHLALGSKDLYYSADFLSERGVEFIQEPPEAYYDLSHQRVNGHQEPIERMKKYGILIDGPGVFEDANDGVKSRVLLQLYTKPVIGSIFFELMERKGDVGFGEGNLSALLESIHEEQIRAGELSMANTL